MRIETKKEPPVKGQLYTWFAWRPIWSGTQLVWLEWVYREFTGYKSLGRKSWKYLG